MGLKVTYRETTSENASRSGLTPLLLFAAQGDHRIYSHGSVGR